MKWVGKDRTIYGTAVILKWLSNFDSASRRIACEAGLQVQSSSTLCPENSLEDALFRGWQIGPFVVAVDVDNSVREQE